MKKLLFLFLLCAKTALAQTALSLALSSAGAAESALACTVLPKPPLFQLLPNPLVKETEVSFEKFKDINSLIIIEQTTCEIQGFEYTQHMPNDGVLITTINVGNKFDITTKNLQYKIKLGDTIYIENIRVRCPGVCHSVKIPSMIWKIK
jgi:hypothetical protein